MFVGARACYRTALEFCKLLLSLDPEGDPLGVLLAVDFYALRAQKYEWLIKLASEWEPSRNLSQVSETTVNWFVYMSRYVQSNPNHYQDKFG